MEMKRKKKKELRFADSPCIWKTESLTVRDEQ